MFTLNTRSYVKTRRRRNVKVENEIGKMVRMSLGTPLDYVAKMINAFEIRVFFLLSFVCSHVSNGQLRNLRIRCAKCGVRNKIIHILGSIYNAFRIIVFKLNGDRFSNNSLIANKFDFSEWNAFLVHWFDFNSA